uniref:F-box/kelch-repeat protein At3g06240-like n=1 Tax=Erigeron canadensis TaxID=72917 RepID=UPI001CB8C338|nr:F-box/kelch-repeat protein At3g06240-like [Erigeron canadensis]
MAEDMSSIRSIPTEMITEILYRLPAKSVGRFRCVSKGWLSLLTEPAFITTHYSKTLNHNHLVFQSCKNRSLYSLSFGYHQDKLSNPTKIRLKPPNTFYGCCNGLVLVSVFNREFGHNLVLINPTTKESLDLPACTLEGILNKMMVIHVMYGFGYDSVTDDYKVIALIYFSSYDKAIQDIHYVSVYSLRSNIWKRLFDYPYDHWHNHWYDWKCLSDAFVNGCLHWVAKKGRDYPPVIVSFSLADEKFRKVPLPNLGKGVDIMSFDDCKLVDLGGKLAVLLHCKGEVWLMNKYEVRKSWTRILLNGLMSLNEFPIMEPLIFDHHGKILFVCRDLMLIYNAETGRFRKLFVTRQNLKDLDVRGMYVESLVSPEKFRTTN